MLKWEFTVSGQTLTRTDRLDTYADMRGQLKAKFDLDEWWNDYIVVAQFARGDVIELRVLQNGVCDVPDAVLDGAGHVGISVYAFEKDRLKTSSETKIDIEPSGIRDNSLIPVPEPTSVWEKVLEILSGLRGGQTGQYLKKSSDDNYSTEWGNIEGTEVSIDGTSNAQLAFQDLREEVRSINDVDVDGTIYVYNLKVTDGQPKIILEVK